jgi:selenocysteine lyase/cysteine desulfurase
MAHAVGALVFVDAVHYAPHILTDVRAIDCDFLACSAYKFYGPHIGILFGKRELLESTQFAKLTPAPETAPERVETGTQNHEGIVGAAATVNFLASLSAGEDRRNQLQTTFAALHARARILVRQLWEGLSRIEGVKLYGPSPDLPRTPTISFTVRDVASRTVAQKLARLGIFVSHGDFYAATTADEVSRLIEVVRSIAAER